MAFYSALHSNTTLQGLVIFYCGQCELSTLILDLKGVYDHVLIVVCNRPVFKSLS